MAVWTDLEYATNHKQQIHELKRNNIPSILVSKAVDIGHKDLFLDVIQVKDISTAMDQITKEYFVNSNEIIVVTDQAVSVNCYDIIFAEQIAKYSIDRTATPKSNSIIDSAKQHELKDNIMSKRESLEILKQRVKKKSDLDSIVVAIREHFKTDNPNDHKYAFKLCVRYKDKYPDVAYELAQAYKLGKGMQKDESMYESALRQASKNGHTKATIEWIRFVIENKKSEHYTEVLEYEESPNAEIKGWVSRLYKDGLGVEKDLNKSIELLTELAESGNGWAVNMYTDLLLARGQGADYQKAYEICVRQCDKNDPWSIGRLARMYRDGIAVEIDTRTAFEMMLTAATGGCTWAKKEMYELLTEQNSGIPQIILQNMSRDGVVIYNTICDINVQDPELSEKIIKVLTKIDSCSPNPHITVAFTLYQTLITKELDCRTGISTLESIDNQMDATIALRIIYEDKNLQCYNIQKAIKYAKMTIKQETGREMNHLIDLLMSSDTFMDQRQAFRLCTRSSELGDAWSTWRLAKMYLHGIGIHKDLKKALVCYEAAANKGVKPAENELQKLKGEGK